MNGKVTNTPANGAPTIDLLEIWDIFWSRRILILICVIAALVLAYVKVNYFTVDTYTANGILYVSNRNRSANTDAPDDMVYGSDINTSQMMSNTYMEILTTRSFLTDVSNAVGGRYTWGQIRGMMSIAVVEETALLRVTVVNSDPKDAYTVANAIIALAPTMLGEIFEGGEIKIVERAIEPTVPNGRNSARTLMLSFLVGLAIGCAIAFVLDYLDTKIHRSDDVAKRYDISILGEISH